MRLRHRFKQIGFWFRTSLLAVCTGLAILLPPLFPKALQLERNKSLPWIFGIILVVVGVIALETFYEKYQQSQDSPERAGETSFIRKYSAALSESIGLLQEIPNYSRDELVKALNQVLKVVRTIVLSYYSDRPGLAINVNVMLAVSPLDIKLEVLNALHFKDPKRDIKSYAAVLHIVHWADPEGHCVPDDFAVPVDTDKERVLFGAPQAFRTRRMQRVGDIRNIKNIEKTLLQHQPSAVVRLITSYLNERDSFRSFASWCIEYGNTAIGVLNVHSSEPYTFGEKRDDALRIDAYVQPFCAIVASLVQAIEMQPPAGKG